MQRHLDPAARHLGDDVPHDAERDGGAVVVRGGAHPAAHNPRSLCYSQQQCCWSPVDSGLWRLAGVRCVGARCPVSAADWRGVTQWRDSSEFILHTTCRGGKGGEWLVASGEQSCHDTPPLLWLMYGGSVNNSAPTLSRDTVLPLDL